MGFESQFPGSARGVDTTGVLLKTHAILSQFGIIQTSCHTVLVCTNIFSPVYKAFVFLFKRP